MDEFLIAHSAVIGQFLFVKLLGLCFLAAFYSLSQQVLGLYGSNGILPIDDYMHIAKQKITENRYEHLPTIFWVKSSDAFLKHSAAAGILFSIFVLLDFAPAFFLFLLTLLYLSFMSVGHEFLSYQWDALLIETGFVGFLYAVQTPPPILVVFLAWFLLFRLLLSSGVVKLLSGCPQWRNLDAMKFHFETQPLPNKGGWYAHNLFKNWTKLFTVGVYIFEIAVPFLTFGGALARLAAALLSIVFQLFIMATGNFAFFNILTIALCVTLIDDRYLSWLNGFSITALPPLVPVNLLLNLTAAVAILLNAFVLLRVFFRLDLLDKIFRKLAPFHLINSYGLFAVMTTERNEIIIEGSKDGVIWEPYEFFWKPGTLELPPGQVAPFQPRLDWQMWFASLSYYQHAPWFHQLLARLLQGSPAVTALFQVNPFTNSPPKYVRALFYKYNFNTISERNETGLWWKRKYLGFYAPSFSLKLES